jgi:hypothetical protein
VRLLSLFFVLFSFNSHASVQLNCGALFSSSGKPKVAGIHRINLKSFEGLSKKNYDQDARYQGYTKFLIEMSNGKPGKVWYFDTNVLPYHADFIRRQFLKDASPDQIDQMTLFQKDRKFLLGTLLSHGKGFDVEWVSEDKLSLKELQLAMKHVQASAKGLAPMQLLAPRKWREQYKAWESSFQEVGFSLAPDAATGIQNEVYAYGWSVGRMLVLNRAQFDEAKSRGELNVSDILVLDHVPREIPPLAGIIVDEPSTPSSHLALLAQMYDIPFLYQQDAFQKYQNLGGQKVLVSVVAGWPGATIEVLPLMPSAFNKLRSFKDIQPLGSAAIDTQQSAISPVEVVAFANSPAFGAKAAGLGLIAKVVPEHALESSFVIPIEFYARLRKDSRVVGSQESLEQYIEKVLRQLKTAPASDISKILAELRATILDTQIPVSMDAQIREALHSRFGDSPAQIFFRSSSNVEDLEGFNGAGLYDSSIASWPNMKSVATAIKTVWASTFSERAYLARQAFGIDEASVGMGIVVQRLLTGQLANGVAVVSRKEGESITKLKIVGFSGDRLAVTEAPEHAIPETTEVKIRTRETQVKRLIATSELPYGRSIMQEQEYKILAAAIEKLRSQYPSKDDLDIEWKLTQQPDGSRKIYLLQVRPVPSSHGKGFKEADLFFVGGKLPTRQFQPESADSIRQYRLPIAVDFETQTQPLAEALNGESWLKSLRFLHRDGTTIDIKPIQAQVRLEKKPHNWLAVHLSATANHPLLGVLTVTSSLSLQMSAEQLATSPVLSYQTLSYSIRVGKDQNFKSDYRVDDRLPAKYRDELTRGASANGKLRFSIQAKSILTNAFQKTDFQEVSEAQIHEQDLGQFTVRAPGLLYAPAHHNFVWSYVLDLQYADASPNLEKLRERYGRYITVARTDLSKTGAMIGYDHNFKEVVRAELALESQMPQGAGFK